ncbi:PKD domain-containing protein [Desertivirga brevis]|uniref:PKD domain-containing protein n=1 Tax=Desertivirga brevis TaxID=2810310 RepID=UPI001A969AF8|nr:PKD domain-containing protein [Pedobacter sp. SYSU D00873]
MLVFFSFSSNAQTLEVGDFDKGTGVFVNGGQISVPIKVTGCFAIGNVFELVISGSDGTFGAGKEKVIGSVASHFTTYINGSMLATAGSNYKLKVRSTSPAKEANVAGGASFSVIGGAPATIDIDCIDKTSGTTPAFGFCDYRTNASLLLINSSSGTNVTGKVYDSDLNKVSDINFTNGQFNLPVGKGYFTAVFTATNPANGSTSVKSYLILNCRRNFAVNLIPADECKREPYKLVFTKEGDQSVLENYPGYIYRVNWGDDTIEQYTICDFASDGIIPHVYAENTSSCGKDFWVDGQKFANSYKVEILGTSPYCEPTPTVKAAKVSKPPIVNFKVPQSGLCVGNELTFDNLSEPGENPDGGTNCDAPTIYYWYVDGSSEAAEIDISKNRVVKPFKYTFLTPGKHEILLVGTTGACTAQRKYEFCVSAKPQPEFNIITNNYCAGASVKLESTTPLAGVCIPVSYQWEVLNNNSLESPADPTAYSFVGSPTNANSEIRFNKPGSYKIRLSVGNLENCGMIKTVKVLTISSSLNELGVSFKKGEDLVLCKPSLIDPTEIELEITGFSNTPTYKWELLNEDGTVISNPSNIYEFPQGDNILLPAINIKKAGKYLLRVTHGNECANPGQIATKKIEVGDGFTVTAVIDPAEGLGSNNAEICGFDLANPVPRSIKLIGRPVLPGQIGNWLCVEAPGGATSAVSAAISNSSSATCTVNGLKAVGPGPAVYKFRWGVAFSNKIECQEAAYITITIYPAPKKGIISKGPGIPCAGEVVTLTLDGYNGVIKHWKFKEDGASAWNTIDNTSNTLTTPVNKNTQFVAVVVGGGTTCGDIPYESDPFTVTVTPLPQPVVLKVKNNGPSNICEGDNLQLELTGYDSNATYFWRKRESGEDWSAEQTLSSSVLDLIGLTKNTDVQIRAIENSCETLSNILTISVRKKPELKIATTEFYLCNNSQTQEVPLLVVRQPGAITMFNLSSDPAYSGNSNINGLKTTATIPAFNTLANGSKVPQIIKVTVTPMYDYGNGIICTGLPVEVKYFVLPTIGISGNPVPSTVCNGEKINAFSPATDAGSLPAGASITYLRVVDPSSKGTDLTSGTDPQIPLISTVNTGSSNLTTKFTITPIYNYGDATCYGTPIDYTIVVKPGTAPNAGVNQNFCTPPVNFRLNANAAPYGFKGEWSVTPALNGFFDRTDPKAFVSGLAPGTSYTFRWTFTSDDNSCPPIFSEIKVNILPALVADFQFENDKSKGCNPLEVKLINKSTVVDGIIYKWELDGQFYSNAKDITIPASKLNQSQPFEDAIHKIKLIVTDGFNCSTSDKSQDIIVYAKPKAVFVPDKLYGCATLPVTFKNESKVSAYIPTDYAMTVMLGSTIVEEKKAQDFKDIETYIFDVTQTKKFTVKLKVSNACGEDETSFDITVYPRTVTAILEADNQIGCAPFTVKFSNNKSFNGKSYEWDFNDGTDIEYTVATEINKPHTFLDAGTYHVKLKVKDDCSTDERELVIVVNESPKASFQLKKNIYCVGEKLEFVKSNQLGVAYSWDFYGNGMYISSPNPDFSYANPGTYTITLKAERSSPFMQICSDVYSQQVIITSLPVASFVTTAGSINCKPYTLTVQSTSPNARAVEWDFGDPGDLSNITTGNTSEHIYTQAGTYTVKMTAYNSEGCISTDIKQVQVTAGPNVDFSSSTETICGPSATLSFTDKTTSTEAGPLKYFWTRNDTEFLGNTKDISGKLFSYTGSSYPHADKVQLTVTNLLTGCSETATKYITYKPLPVADFQLISDATGCAPLAIKVNNKSKNADAYEWILDGVVVATGADPQLPVLQQPNKVYKLKLRVLNVDCGNAMSSEITISTYPKPSAAFTLENDLGCNGSLRLKVTSNTTSGASSYIWEYDEGPAQTGLIPQERAFGTGDHWVRLIADNGVCKDTLQKNFKVIDLQIPVIKPSVDAGCGSVTVKFTSTAPNDVNYEWDFGILGQSSLKEPVKVFNYQDGNKPYPVTLTIRYGTCVQQSATRYINVSGPPVADFDVSPDTVIKAPKFTFDFINRSSADANRYTWAFGDGKISYEKNPTHKFPAIGKYQVKLTVRNENGCDSTMIKYVRVDTIPCYMQVPNAFEPGSLHPELQTFRPKALGLTSYSIRVFNRWGELLWQSNKLDDSGSPVEGWDGTINGSPAPQGVYVWEISGSFVDGTEWKGMSYSGSKGRKIRNGSVTLIR